MAKRKSIHVKGMEHGAPIPNGTIIGNMVFSSAISGKDAKTGGALPPGMMPPGAFPPGMSPEPMARAR